MHGNKDPVQPKIINKLNTVTIKNFKNTFKIETYYTWPWGTVSVYLKCVVQWIFAYVHIHGSFPGHTSGKEPNCRCRRLKRYGFHPWVRKIPWRRKWQPTPVFLPGKSNGQRTLEGYSPWGHKESDWATNTLTFFHIFIIAPPRPKYRILLASQNVFLHPQHHKVTTIVRMTIFASASFFSPAVEVWILNHLTTREVPVLLLLDLGINEVIHIVILCVWLSLFNTMSLRLIHVVVCTQ